MSTARAEKPKPVEMVSVELNPSAGVDVLGNADTPLLAAGTPRLFTPTEADGLLALVNTHGTPICRIVSDARGA